MKRGPDGDAGDASSERRKRRRRSRFSDATSVAAAPSGGAAAAAAAQAAGIAAALAKAKALAARVTSSLQPTPPTAETAQQRAHRLQAEIAARMASMSKHLEAQGQAGLMNGSAAGKSARFVPAPLILDNQGREVDAQGNLVSALHRKTRVVSSTLVGQKQQRMAQRVDPSANPYLQHKSAETKDKVPAKFDPRVRTGKRARRGAKAFKFIAEGSKVREADKIRDREARQAIAREMAGQRRASSLTLSFKSVGDTAQPRMMPAAVSAGNRAGKGGASSSSGANTVALGVRGGRAVLPRDPREEEEVPVMEWWDREFLSEQTRREYDSAMAEAKKLAKGGSGKSQRGDGQGGDAAAAAKAAAAALLRYEELSLDHCETSELVEHPALVDALVKKPEITAVPMMLTKRERKRIRRQERLERERAKQEKIKLGLMDAPAPKVKISNLMRVLGEEAVADPSAVEKRVRSEMAQRVKNHEMRNLARKLTPAERREKRKRKLVEDTSYQVAVAVFRVADLSNPQHRFKVDVNAQQSMLTGVALMCKEGPSSGRLGDAAGAAGGGGINMVVVEGGPKAIRRFVRLMTVRIKWGRKAGDDGMVEDDEEFEDEDEDGAGGSGAKRRNACSLVWEGSVHKRSFKTFRFEDAKSAAAARNMMKSKQVAHYWDSCIAGGSA